MSDLNAALDTGYELCGKGIVWEGDVHKHSPN